MQMRKSAVAGQFYPAGRKKLDELLNECYQQVKSSIDGSLAERKLIGGIVPHAGYMFSACHAMHFFDILKRSPQQYDTFIILHPNHSGHGPDIALDPHTHWESPYGAVELDKEMEQHLGFEYSSNAHAYEHSGEVMVPLLQYRLEYEFKILPVSITHQNHPNASLVAQRLIEASKAAGKNIILIASSDFSHFSSARRGAFLDQLVIDRIMDQDARGVEKVVKEKNISVCGYGPIMALMEYAGLSTGKHYAKVLSKGNSGEVIPSEEVVDYVSILLYA